MGMRYRQVAKEIETRNIGRNIGRERNRQTDRQSENNKSVKLKDFRKAAIKM